MYIPSQLRWRWDKNYPPPQNTAAVLPLSTAEVERVFSQVKLVKCDHINRMKQVTMNNILHVKLNCNKQCYEHVSDTVVAFFENPTAH
jgi:hypothetical protein